MQSRVGRFSPTFNTSSGRAAISRIRGIRMGLPSRTPPSSACAPPSNAEYGCLSKLATNEIRNQVHKGTNPGSALQRLVCDQPDFHSKARYWRKDSAEPRVWVTQITRQNRQADTRSRG